jgi:hypothetical protein
MIARRISERLRPETTTLDARNKDKRRVDLISDALPFGRSVDGPNKTQLVTQSFGSV